MPHPKPNKFESIQQFLDASGFVINQDFFVCGMIRFPATEICGHTVATFLAKMKERGWMPPDMCSTAIWP